MENVYVYVIVFVNSALSPGGLKNNVYFTHVMHLNIVATLV